MIARLADKTYCYVLYSVLMLNKNTFYNVTQCVYNIYLLCDILRYSIRQYPDKRKKLHRIISEMSNTVGNFSTMQRYFGNRIQENWKFGNSSGRITNLVDLLMEIIFGDFGLFSMFYYIAFMK